MNFSGQRSDLTWTCLNLRKRMQLAGRRGRGLGESWEAIHNWCSKLRKFCASRMSSIENEFFALVSKHL